MNSSSLIKIVAAFVTGILVALVGTIAYVKIAGRSPSEPVVRSAPMAAVAPLQEHAPEHAYTPEHADTLPGEEHPVGVIAEPRSKTSRPDTLSSIGHKFKHHSGRGATAETSAGNEVAQAQVPSRPDNAATAPQTEPQSQGTTPEAAALQSPPVRQPQTVTLDTGLSLVIRLNEGLSSNRNYAGDTFHGALELPITMNGFIIAEKGAKVLGRVVNVRKPGRIQGLADLSVALTQIDTTDGQRVAVQTSSFDKKGASSTRNDAAKVGGGAAIGAIIGAIAGGGKGAGIGAGIGGAAGVGDVLLTHGQAAVIPNETILTFRLSAPVTITERLN